MEISQQAHPLRVVVGSGNPVKLQAVRQAFLRVFPHISCEVEGRKVASGVADQPQSDAETLRGAEQRARACRSVAPNADYWIGLEGGIARREGAVEAFAWMVVMGRRQLGKARSASFMLPPKVVELLDEGLELGAANDKVFGHTHSKQKQGAVGLLTHNLIDRTELYAQAVVLALIPFLNESLFFSGEVQQ